MRRPDAKIAQHIRRGDIVRVVWQDACEGSAAIKLSEMSLLGLRECTESNLVSVGRFLRILNGRLLLDEVIREETKRKILYEKQGPGKWLSIPLGAVYQLTPLDDADRLITNQTKRRRTILKQLRFVPRSTKLPNGEPSRTLYVT